MADKKAKKIKFGGRGRDIDAIVNSATKGKMKSNKGTITQKDIKRLREGQTTDSNN